MNKTSSSFEKNESTQNKTSQPIYKSKTTAYEGANRPQTEPHDDKNTHIRSSKTTLSSFKNNRELRALQILSNNVNNVRYPGFSEFQSQNTMQNSSYCWSFPKTTRFNDGKKVLNPTMYTLPSILSKRTTSMGFGERKVFPVNKYGNPSPDTYNLRTVFDMNLLHSKGAKLLAKSQDFEAKKGRFKPGPGAYTVTKENLINNMPIKLKSRIGFFYDDDLKKKKHCVSMQRYHPDTTLEENLRFRNITFGIGGRTPNENRSVKGNPGPGYYKVPGCFDRGLKGKLVLN